MKKAKQMAELEENRTSKLQIVLEFQKREFTTLDKNLIKFKIHKYSCSLIYCRYSVRVRHGR